MGEEGKRRVRKRWEMALGKEGERMGTEKKRGRGRENQGDKKKMRREGEGNGRGRERK